MKKVLSVMLTIVILVALCLQAAAISAVEISSLSLNTTKVTLKIGEYYSIKPIFQPSNTTQKQLYYTCNNYGVLSVDNNGLVKALNGGTTEITITSKSNNKIMTTLTVVVSEVKAAKVTWLVRIAPQTNRTLVLDEVNKILKDKINVRLDIKWIAPSAYNDSIMLKHAAGETHEIEWSNANLFQKLIINKGYMPIDNLLQKYAKDLLLTFPNELFNAMKYKNQIYGVPNYQIEARQTVALFVKEYADAVGLKDMSTMTVEQLEPYLLKMKDIIPKDAYVTNSFAASYGSFTSDILTGFGYEPVSTTANFGVIKIDSKDYKVIDFTKEPSFIKAIQLTRSWVDKGIIKKDLSLNKNILSLFPSKQLAGIIGQATYKPGGKIEQKNRYNGVDFIEILMSKPYVSTGSILGTITCMNSNAANPEGAMRFLDILNTDREVFNLLVYGLNKVNYTKIDKNYVNVKPNSGYNVNGTAWIMGNTFNRYLIKGEDPKVLADTIKLNQEATKSRILGFSFDSTPIQLELSQVSTVMVKYLDGLGWGFFEDVDGTYKKFIDELSNAGMAKIIAEQQKQLDAWAKDNNVK